MQYNQIIEGDALTVLQTMETASVQTVVTSPPYYKLRDYQVEGQLGQEATPDLFVQALVNVFSEIKRVLRLDGTCWLNLGDTMNDRQFLMMPARVALALQSDGWLLRQTIIWNKTNPMPEPVRNRPTTAHEYVFLLAQQERYYYDAEAIREPITSESSIARNKSTPRTFGKSGKHNLNRSDRGRLAKVRTEDGRNKRSVWTMPTEIYKDTNYAVMPSDLAATCILAGSKPGDVILDPFSGMATTAYAASKLGRNWIGIELQAEYIKLAEKRLYQQPLDLYGLEAS